MVRARRLRWAEKIGNSGSFQFRLTPNPRWPLFREMAPPSVCLSVEDRGGQLSSPAEFRPPPGRSPLRGLLGFSAKLAITVACLWYVSRSISWADFVRLSSMTSPTWVALSVLIIMVQIPLVGLRWCLIVEALSQNERRPRRTPLMAITAIGLFFGQVAPNVVGDSMRVWLLTRLGRPWREGLVSVLIDRGVGVGVLLAITFCILLFPSGLTALGGYRVPVLGVIGALLTAGVSTLALAPLFAPVFARWQLS